MDTPIQHFNRQTISVLQKDIQSMLDQIKNKYGLTELTMNSIYFNAFSFTAKIAATLHEHRQFADTYASEEAKYFAELNGLPQDLLNKKFVSNGKNHTIIRIETRNPKYPIITNCSEDGKNYKFSVQIIKEILDRTI